MGDKVLDVIFGSVLFLFIYGLFGALYSGLILSVPDSGGRLALTGIYGVFAIGGAVWLLIKANSETETRKPDATASLACITLFASCGLAFLMPDALLQSDMLWLFFKSCCITVGVIIVVVAVMLAVFTLLGD